MSNRAERRRQKALSRKVLADVVSGSAAGPRFEETLRLAGLPHAHGGYRTKHAPWTISDVLWFQANPSRTHRIRRPIGNELAEFGNPPRPRAAPDDYQPFMLIRQIEPGRHARIPVWLHSARPEDDTDPRLSALLDATVEIAISGIPVGNLDHVRATAAATERLVGRA